MTRIRRLLSADSLAYAAGEVAIIVVGVLIALGADAWWDARQEAGLREEYRSALVADLVADSAWYGYTIESGWIPDMVSAVDSLEVAVIDDVDRPEEVVALWVAQTFRLVAGQQSDGAYRELLATGGLDLFGDPRLRRAIVSYYGQEITVDRDVYGIWIERTVFPWWDEVRRVAGAAWFGGLQRCLATYRPTDPALDEELAACTAALERVDLLSGLRQSPEAVAHVQNMYMPEAVAGAGALMVEAQRCLITWLRTGERTEALCAGLDAQAGPAQARLGSGAEGGA